MMTNDNLLTPADATAAVNEYVCAVCHHDLEILDIPGDFLKMIVCPIHGDATVVGRVTRATVSIQNENEAVQFHSAITNLADLFPEIQNAGMTRDTALKTQKTHVCAVGGCLLDVSATDNTFTAYRVTCRRHPGGGDVRKDNFKYDFRAMKAWEAEHKKGRV